MHFDLMSIAFQPILLKWDTEVIKFPSCLKGKYHIEELGVDEMMVLKLILG
jgi:hypothetical protein